MANFLKTCGLYLFCTVCFFTLHQSVQATPPGATYATTLSEGYFLNNDVKYSIASDFGTANSAFFRQITGLVTDTTGAPLVGVTVYLKGKKNIGTMTDQNGRFILEVPEQATLVFTMVGYDDQEMELNGENSLNIVMSNKNDQLDEVVVVAFGKQKKADVVGSVTTINPKILKTPSSNLTTALAGQIAGVIAYQRSGEPGQDNAEFFIRGITTFGAGKKDPLILIDGRESSTNDLARLQPDDIEGFSILKDATATSVYGARGANGVVLVSTKTGDAGKTRFNVRFENSISSNTRNFKLADNITYMKLANEAVATRDPLNTLYSESKIAHTEAGDDPYIYPNNDWMKQMVRDNTYNSRLNFNLSGGTDRVRYYIAGTYNIDNGLLKTVNTNNFNSNVKSKNYEVRSNVDIKLTNTTNATVRTTGRFSDYNGPIGGGSGIFNQIITANPVRFPAFFPNSFLPGVKHPLFGNEQTQGGLYTNPFANMVSGFQQTSTSGLVAQLEIDQDFDFILPGFSMRMMAYTQRNSSFSLNRKYSPFFYRVTLDDDGKVSGLELLNETSASSALAYSEGAKVLNTNNYLEVSANYDKTYNEKHKVTGMLIGIMSNYLTANAGSLQLSLPHRNLGVSGRFTYGYDGRYLAEFDFGYNGSERFSKDHRFGFFPSVGFAWNVSKENFWSDFSGAISSLKLRGTYGLVGNDQIGSDNDRFFYIADVNLNDGGKGYRFGDNFLTNIPGISIKRYENPNISWEKSYKADVGLDLGMFNEDLTIQLDFYKERRTDILMPRAFIPTTMGLNPGAPVQANVGEAEGKGVDLALDYSTVINNHNWITIRGNFTYAASKYIFNEEPNYPENEKYQSKIGYSLGQQWGLIADRYFVDQKEVANSPKQNYGGYEAGDLKYLDVNGDGQITDLDRVPIGYPVTPEIIYGFGFSYGFHSFDFSAFFQGSARSSFFINPGAISPFVNNHGLLDVIAQSHWSENNRDEFAFWPRLSTEAMNNNQVSSTWWLRNGAFVRLKKVELGYTVQANALNRMKIKNLRFYANALNLFALSKFKLWDVEMGGNGLGYPIQRVINFGLNLGF